MPGRTNVGSLARLMCAPSVNCFLHNSPCFNFHWGLDIMADPPAALSLQGCAPSQQNRKRTAITLEAKKTISKDHSNRLKVSALMVKYGLSQSTISTIICFITKLCEWHGQWEPQEGSTVFPQKS